MAEQVQQFVLEISKSDFMVGLKDLPIGETFTVTNIIQGEPWKIKGKEIEKFDFTLTDGQTIGVAHATFRKSTVNESPVPLHGLEVRIPHSVQFQIVEGEQKIIDNKMVTPRWLNFLTEVSAFS